MKNDQLNYYLIIYCNSISVSNQVFLNIVMSEYFLNKNKVNKKNLLY